MSDSISALLHAVGVNFGDHGETVVTAVAGVADETVRGRLERLIPAGRRYRNREYGHFVTLRFVLPAAVLDEMPPAPPAKEPF